VKTELPIPIAELRFAQPGPSGIIGWSIVDGVAAPREQRMSVARLIPRADPGQGGSCVAHR
jgi:hypothetical protein